MITYYFDKFINSVSENNHICNILTNSLSRDIEKYKPEESRFFSGTLYLANDPFSPDNNLIPLKLKTTDKTDLLNNKPKYLSDIFGFYYCRNFEAFERYWKDIFSYCLFQKYSGDFFLLQKFLKGGKEFRSKISSNFNYEEFRCYLDSSKEKYLNMLMDIVSDQHPQRSKVKKLNSDFISFFFSFRHHLVHTSECSIIPSKSLIYVKQLLQNEYKEETNFNMIMFNKDVFKMSYQALIDHSYQLYKLCCEFLEIENEIIKNKKSSYTS